MRVITILLTATTALAGLTLARAAREPPVAAAPAGTPSAPVRSQPSSDRSAVGTLEQVDAATQHITVATSAGRLAFRVQRGATIRQGSKVIKPSELPAHKGERVKVRYRESRGERNADWIVLAVPARRTPKPRD